jgi:hypothetical protein
MKSLVFMIGLVFLLASCDLFVPPPIESYCGDEIVQTPNDYGVFEACDWGMRNSDTCDPETGGACETCTTNCQLVGFADEALLISAPEQVILPTMGSSAFASVPITVSRDAQWRTWVEETVLFIGDDALQMSPFDTTAAGTMTRVTPRLVLDGSVSYYSFAFDPAAPLAGFDPQLELFTTVYEVHEHDGSLVFARPASWYSVSDEPVWVHDTFVSLVLVDEVVLSDDGPTAAVLRFSYDGEAFYRQIAFDHSYDVIPGISIEIDVIDDEVVSIVVSGLVDDTTVLLGIGETVEIDFGLDTFELTLEGVLVDRETRVVANLETDDGVFTVGEHDLFSIAGRTYIVDTLGPSSGDPAFIRFMEADHIVRVSDGFEQWGSDGWMSVAGVDARIERDGKGIVEIVFEQDHSMSGHEDAALSLFAITDHWDDPMVSLKDAYSYAAIEAGDLWFSGREPGTYTIVIEARDGDETARETVELVVTRVHGDPPIV